MVSKPMCELKNIGKTVSTRLHGIGITNEVKLKRLGAEKAKPIFSEANSNKFGVKQIRGLPLDL